MSCSLVFLLTSAILLDKLLPCLVKPRLSVNIFLDCLRFIKIVRHIDVDS